MGVAPKLTELRFSRETSPTVDSDTTLSLITSAKDWTPPKYVIHPEEDKRVLMMRTKEVIGKTIIGTFFMKDKEPYVKHWIRWNEKKADNIFVPKEMAHQLFDGQPKSGAKVTTTITAIGPANVSAWQMHPQCKTFKIIRMPLYDTDYSKKAAETLKMRRDELLGKTVTGTFFTRDVDSETKHYIRWNDKRADNVLVREEVVRAAFNGKPISGTKVCATITNLGPKGVSPWRMNPLCETMSVVKRWSPVRTSKPSSNTSEWVSDVATRFTTLAGSARSTGRLSPSRPSYSSVWANETSSLSSLNYHRECSPCVGSKSIWGPPKVGNRFPAPSAGGSATFTSRIATRMNGRTTPVKLGSAFAQRAMQSLEL